MPRQLIFPLPAKPALGRDDFFVSPANSVAVATIENWKTWPQNKLVLFGASGSGKTHLAHVWADMSSGKVIDAVDLAKTDISAWASEGARLVVEDVDRVAGNAELERALFHLHNLVLAEQGFLLLTGEKPPRHWEISLPDLASRIQATNAVQLEPPDDELLTAILLKLFADRQLTVSPLLVDYLVKRMDRSFEGAQRLVAALDDAALSEQRSITRALAAAVLDNGTKGAA